MRILYHHRIASRDGQFVHLSAIVRELQGLGHEVSISGPRIGLNGEVGGQNATVTWMKSHIPAVAYELMEFGYSFVDFFRLLWKIHCFRPAVIYERSNLFFTSGIWASRIAKIPLLLEINAPFFEERSRHGKIRLKRLARWTERHTWKHADCLLPVTHVLEEIIRSNVTPKRVEVIPNGISPEEMQIQRSPESIRAEMGIGGRRVLGFVGFVREWNRLERVLDYISARPEDVVFVVVGEGPDCERLESYAQERGIRKRLFMAGVVERHLIASYINIFDVAILPDVNAYASPLKLFEYLALGRVIVAPDTDNIREIVVDRVHGLLFQQDDDSSLFEALDVGLNPVDNNRLSLAATDLIVKRGFNWKQNALKIQEIAKSLT